MTVYCCLGVLCDLYGKATGVDWRRLAGREEILPIDVVMWAGLDERDPQLKSLVHDGVPYPAMSCTAANDDNGCTFDDIAAAIEIDL